MRRGQLCGIGRVSVFPRLQVSRFQGSEAPVALCRHRFGHHVIPSRGLARLELPDGARIDEGFARTGHTTVPLVWELSRLVGEPHGGWVPCVRRRLDKLGTRV